jgi:hypothetical protein
VSTHFTSKATQTIPQLCSGYTGRVPEHYDLTLADPDNKLGRDVAIMRADIEELHAKLARMPAVIARAALGIIFCTAAITTFLDWWLLFR